MKIKSVKRIGKRKVYDISVEDVEHYLLENGVVSHNTGSYYASDNIYILTRSQEKDGGELDGFNFTINVEKSRFVKEKAKIPITVRFNEGINRYSGLMDIALELGFCFKPSNGWYSKKGEEKKYRLKDTYNKDFWESLLNSEDFKNAVYNHYSITSGSIIGDDDSVVITEETKEDTTED